MHRNAHKLSEYVVVFWFLLILSKLTIVLFKFDVCRGDLLAHVVLVLIPLRIHVLYVPYLDVCN